MAESRVELTFSDPGAGTDKSLGINLGQICLVSSHTLGLGAASRRQLMLLVGAGAAATLLCTALVLIFCFCR